MTIPQQNAIHRHEKEHAPTIGIWELSTEEKPRATRQVDTYWRRTAKDSFDYAEEVLSSLPKGTMLY